MAYRNLLRRHPAGHELRRHTGPHQDAQARVEEERAPERVTSPGEYRADAAERPELGRPTVDERLVGRWGPRDGEGLGPRPREQQGAAEPALGSHGHAGGVEPQLRELEA